MKLKTILIALVGPLLVCSLTESDMLEKMLQINEEFIETKTLLEEKVKKLECDVKDLKEEGSTAKGKFESCKIPILSADHIHDQQHYGGNTGVYFNFEMKHIEGLNAGGTLKFYGFNPRPNNAGRVVVWGSTNGGSSGDSHGRFDGDPVNSGYYQWQTGDVLVPMDPVFCATQCEC